MKSWRLPLAAGGVWELLRFVLLFAAAARLAGAVGIALLVVPFGAPALIAIAAYGLLIRGEGSKEILSLLRLAKLLAAVACMTGIAAGLVAAPRPQPAVLALLAGSALLDLIFLLVLVSYQRLTPQSHPSAEASPQSGNDGCG